tara:strand:- start:3982 stop:5073 length:1092 start_codon:yes stop_codon:yes gene_type:complete
MKRKIVIIGSTGKLGSKLLKYILKNKISIFAVTCFKNEKKILEQKKKYKIKHIFALGKKNDQINFLDILKTKIDIIYFLDYGSYSLNYLNYFLKFNSNSVIAIANKELIIAGGSILQKKIISKKNIFIPLDSEHFSLINSKFNKENIYKIYITASGGPFYFNKNLDLSKVSSQKVLSHPKWKMGTNNLIDSSNFINKILEIYELSHIYEIPLSKIDFLICKEAYIHSLLHFNDNTVSLNCFTNNMLITLMKPLSYFYELKPLKKDVKFLNIDNLRLKVPNDNRFKVLKIYKKLCKYDHYKQILFMIINNKAHNLYLSNKLNYNDIIDYVMSEIQKHSKPKELNTIDSILKFVSKVNNYYKTNV